MLATVMRKYDWRWFIEKLERLLTFDMSLGGQGPPLECFVEIVFFLFFVLDDLGPPGNCYFREKVNNLQTKLVHWAMKRWFVIVLCKNEFNCHFLINSEIIICIV